jgi:HSP20 family molecular chaperone IbpA
MMLGMLALQMAILVCLLRGQGSGGSRLAAEQGGYRSGLGSETGGAATESAQATAASGRAGPSPEVAAYAQAVADPFAAAAFHRARHLQGEMDRALAQAVSDFERMSGWFDVDTGWESLSASPAMDMRLQGDRYVVLFSLPPVDASGVSVTLDGQLLTVLVPSRPRRAGYEAPPLFERKVRLPGPVDDAENAEAHLTNGVLRVIIPRSRDGISSPKRWKLL